MKSTTLCALAVMLCSCLTTATAEGRAQLSSGHIGCMPEEITTTEAVAGVYPSRNWEAECHGRTFICSEVLGRSGTVACSPKL
jgi:hypothetical protein